MEGQAASILEARGQGIFEFAENPEAANVASSSGNFMIAAAMEEIDEALAHVRKAAAIRRDLEMLTKHDLAALVFRLRRCNRARTFHPRRHRLPPDSRTSTGA